MIRRNLKILSILCPTCRAWVKPRRWDKAIGCCFTCSAMEPTMVDAVDPALTFPALTSNRRRPAIGGR